MCNLFCVTEKMTQEEVRAKYFNPREGLWSKKRLARKYGFPMAKVKEEYSKLAVEQMMKKETAKQYRKQFEKIQTYPRFNNRDFGYFGDLMDLTGQKKKRLEHTGGIRYVLAFINGFSRKVYAWPLKTKTKAEIFPIFRCV